MLENTTKRHWLKIGAVALVSFLAAFLAFYIVMEIMINRITNPVYQVKRMEKAIEKQDREFERYIDKHMENPFEPKMRPMIVNLVKEPSEYKVIVDLTQLDGNEDAVKIDIEGDELVVKGSIDKKVRGTEKIINFTQTYYLDEKLEESKITKERKGDKYIVTIPFNNEDVEKVEK